MEQQSEVVVKALQAFLAGAPDLDAMERAIAREREIRIMMARSGQGRGPAADMIDVEQSMAEEAVLDLTDGEPTTLVDTLQRYLSELACRGELQPRDQITTELEAILRFPWPEDERLVSLHNPHYGLMLHFRHDKNRDLIVQMGNERREVARVSWEDAGSGGIEAVEAVARAVYKATLARVLPDRDHSVKLSRAQVDGLRVWLQSAGMNLAPTRIREGRLALDVHGSSVIITTMPYAHGRTEDKSF